MTYEGPIGLRMQAPSSKASVSLTVAEALTAMANAAPADRKVQALMGFVLAQGLAKAEGDKLVFQIDTATPRALSIKPMALIEEVSL